jgi:hypothetical protein
MGPSNELAAIRQAEQDSALDDVLSRWHHWRAVGGIVKGYADHSLVCGDYRSSRQYDDVNGALDDELESARMEQVDFEVSELLDPWRSAIHSLARSLCTGAAVFHSPRIAPADRARVTAEGRVKIQIRLISAGVLTLG